MPSQRKHLSFHIKLQGSPRVGTAYWQLYLFIYQRSASSFCKTSVENPASQAGLLQLKGKILPLDVEKLLADQEAAGRPQLMRRPWCRLPCKWIREQDWRVLSKEMLWARMACGAQGDGEASGSTGLWPQCFRADQTVQRGGGKGGRESGLPPLESSSTLWGGDV